MNTPPLDRDPSSPPPPRGKWIMAGVLLLLVLAVYISIYWKVYHYGP
ncbi:MAG: hypothetical protein HQL66_11600 [Magnetococcales bacterium]|nr:hypothetical protein [Magnetococcales bacterium]